MDRLFTPKQRSALDRALAECAACRELATVLRQIGMPNDYKEEENKMIEQSLLKAKELDANYVPPPAGG